MNYLTFLALSVLAVEHLPTAVIGVAVCVLFGVAALLLWYFLIPHTVSRPRRKVRKQANRYPRQFRTCAVGCMA